MENKVISYLSSKIAVGINKRAQLSSVAKLEYALIGLINLVFTISIVIVFCLVTGNLMNGIISILGFMLLKRFSGGIHFQSANMCNIASALFVIISIYLTKVYWYNGFVLNLIALLLVVIYAPSGSTAPESLHFRFKITAALIVSANFIFQSCLLANVFFIQAVTTPSFLQKMLDDYNSKRKEGEKDV